jgi:hypothetical protein
MATLTARPNSMYVNPGQATGKVTISWNCTGQTPCRVYEKLSSSEPAIGPVQVQGTIKVDAALGSHIYRLKQTTTSKVLAIANVTVQQRRAEIFTSVGEGLKVTNAIPIQAILRVSVRPQAETAIFHFRTIIPSIPMLEVRLNDPDTGQLVIRRVPLFGGARGSHTLEVDELPQATTLFFKITAGNRLLPSAPPAVLRGSFRTGRVEAGIIFDRILLINDSDDLSDAEMTFRFFAGNTETMPILAAPGLVHKEEGWGDGETGSIGQMIMIENASPRIWVEVQGEEDDSGLPVGGIGFGTQPGTGATTGFWRTVAYDMAWIRSEFDTLNNGAIISGLQETPFTMKTGEFPLMFEVFGRLRLNSQRGIGFRSDPAVPYVPGMIVTEPVVVALSGKKTKIGALGPDGSVYYKEVGGDEAGADGDQWVRLSGRFAGLLAAVAADESQFHLFALNADGAVHRAAVADGTAGDEAEADWQPLGGPPMTGALAAVAGPHGRLEVFGLDCEGNMLHRSLSPGGRGEPNGEWERLGAIRSDCVASLAPVFAPRIGLALFALSCDGRVLHKRRPRTDWLPGGDEWEELGGETGGVLTARLQEDGSLLVVVIGVDRSVRALTWRDYPEGLPNAWEEFGPLDGLLESLGQETAPGIVLVAALAGDSANAGRAAGSAG